MKQKIIQQGAEAKIILKDNFVIKDRISKHYRIQELDNTIRKRRTKAELKLLEKASKIINAPKPYTKNEKFKIKMPFIEGKKISEHLDRFPLKKQKQICRLIGLNIAKLHEAGIIHGDLTTSNMIFVPADIRGNPKIFFIDFGLGFHSQKIEDKAVDIHLLKQALEAKHFKNWRILFSEFEKSYKKNLGNSEAQKVIERMCAVEKRGRYRH